MGNEIPVVILDSGVESDLVNTICATANYAAKWEMVLCKGIAVIICVAMIMTLLLPAASGSVEGDSRGGAT
ncbi:hypothetical protein OSJ98_26465, partial [Escherichia coli]|nr:hypothetical protein [Escherichia coli]